MLIYQIGIRVIFINAVNQMRNLVVCLCFFDMNLINLDKNVIQNANDLNRLLNLLEIAIGTEAF